MKLATYKDGSRDGQLLVVSRDLTQAHYATGIAPTLRHVLDDWNYMAPQLQDLYVALNQGRARYAFAFDPRMCMAPLPRAQQWLGSGACDHLLGPCDEVVLADQVDSLDFCAQVAVVTGDVPMGVKPAQALEGVRLLVLANSWMLHPPMTDGLPVVGGHASAPQVSAVAFGPVAVTPDEAGGAWQRGRLSLPLRTSRNGGAFELADAGASLHHFGQIVAQWCRNRPLHTGTLVGGGPVGASGIGSLHVGDTLHIALACRDGQSLFGAIEQMLVPLESVRRDQSEGWVNP